MSRITFFILLIVFFLFPTLGWASTLEILEGKEIFSPLSDGYLVELRENTSPDQFFHLIKGTPLLTNSLSQTISRRISLEWRNDKRVEAIEKLNRLQRIVVVGGVDAAQLRDWVRLNPKVSSKFIKSLEPNLVLRPFFQPNDPYLNQSTIFTDGTRDAYSIPNLNLNGTSGAWKKTQGSPNVVIAVVDTGVDKTHPDLSSNIWTNPGEIPGNGIDDDQNGYVDDVSGWDFANDLNDSDDDNGHGTHVAGLIAAVANNAIGIPGVCPNCRVFGVKVLRGSGSGSIAWIVQGILYAVGEGADVINMSLGAKGFSQTLQDSIDFAFNMDTVVVVAAGNSSDAAEFFTPAGIRRAVTIAAADPKKNNASFSNYGLAIDVAAPGGGDSGNIVSSQCQSRYNVISLLAANAGFPSDPRIAPCILGTSFVRLAGTSMASPNAAGVAGLIRSLNPTFNADQVAAAMKFGGDNIGDFDLFQGHGHLDGVRALKNSTIADVRFKNPSLIPPKFEKSALFEGIIKNPSSKWGLSYRPITSENFLLIAENFPLRTDGSFSFSWNFPPDMADGEFFARLESGDATDYGVLRKGPTFFTETNAGYFTPGSAYSSVVLDVDKDGDRDIVQANIAGVSASGLEPQQNFIFIGDGLGGFKDETATRMPVLLDFTTSILTGDFNRDGYVDLFHVNFNLTGGIPHFILLNDGKGKFVQGGSISFSGFMCGYEGDVGDVDKDGDLDIILGGSCLGGNILLLNDGLANFVDASQSAGFGVGADNYYGGKFVDVNKDGYLDAVFNTTGPGGMVLLLNNKNLTFTDISNRLPTKGPGGFQVAVADLDLDGYPDLYGGRGRLYMNQGKSNPGWFTYSLLNERNAAGVDYLTSYEFGDLDRDRDSDFVGFGGNYIPGTSSISN
ncbi:MAG TPA: S8 family serine peptidase, partial [Bdellovibrionota bacterium]|nr:S8 family serine peptidase [Bdellovibrionota bacterium]